MAQVHISQLGAALEAPSIPFIFAGMPQDRCTETADVIRDFRTLAVSLDCWCPITPANTIRYSRISCVSPQHLTLEPGCALGTETKDLAWFSFVHPEGQAYFTRELPNYRVVVDANIRDADVEKNVQFWVKRMDDFVAMHDVQLPGGTLELYLEPHDSDQSEFCSYYFINHTARAVFWIQPLGTEMLGMGPGVSDAHFRFALERFYWVHVEYFPNHLATKIPQEIVDDLVFVLSHGQADRMTSSTSTFPYTAEKCEQFLRLVRPMQGKQLNEYSLCVVARLMGAVANQRFMTYYGQENAQLDRLQQVLPCDAVEYPRLMKSMNWALWGIPRVYLTQLEDLFINDQVFADHWTTFLSSCLRDWSTSMTWAFPVLIASLLLSVVGGTSLPSAMPAILSCAASIASGSILYSRHQHLAEASASSAALYLRAAKTSSPLGFVPSAVIFSVPRACYFWSLCFFGMHFFLLLSHMVGRWAVALASTLLVSLVCAVLWVSSPEEEQQFFGGLLSLWPTLPFWRQGQPQDFQGPEHESLV